MPTPTITAALKELDQEYESLLWAIERVKAAPLDSFTSYEELQKLLVKRDQMANCRNNLRAFYADE